MPLSDRVEVIIGTAGHIDHGKTSVVRCLTGVDTDHLPAEKSRGMTIDLGFARLDLGARRLGLIDVPGHDRFIRNMLAGATGIDLAMLVIAADDSIMPQTREHLELLGLLGIRQGVVVLSKCDLVDPEWRVLVREEIRMFLKGSCLEDVTIVEVSSQTGEGIAALRSELCTLIASVCPRTDPGPFRMAIDRSFSVEGYGTVVTGSVASGRVSVGDEVELQPGARRLRVRGLHSHDERVETVVKGARAALNLAGVHHSEVRRGDVLATPDYLASSSRLLVELKASAFLDARLETGRDYRLHIGTLDTSAKLTLLGTSKSLMNGKTSLGLLEPREPVAAVFGEAFVLRRQSPPATLGGGRVLQPKASRFRKNDSSFIERMTRFATGNPAERLVESLRNQGLTPTSELSICRDTGIAWDQIGPLREQLKVTGELILISVGSRRAIVMESGFVHEIEFRILHNLDRLHNEYPRQSSILRAQIEASMAYLEHPSFVLSVLDRMVARGQLVAIGRGLAIKGFEPKLSQGERKLKAEIAEAFRNAGASPPDPAIWMTKSITRAAAVPELLALLCVEEQLVAISPEIYLDFEVAQTIEKQVRERFSDGRNFTMAELRDLIGTTRKYAVPIGEYLDRIGVTLREGDLRRIQNDRAGTR
jgi:selenocysteine-specific elongation factor